MKSIFVKTQLHSTAVATFLVLPSTTASCVRSFCGLRRLKTFEVDSDVRPTKLGYFGYRSHGFYRHSGQLSRGTLPASMLEFQPGLCPTWHGDTIPSIPLRRLQHQALDAFGVKASHLCSICRGGGVGGCNPHWLRMTPTTDY